MTAAGASNFTHRYGRYVYLGFCDLRDKAKGTRPVTDCAQSPIRGTLPGVMPRCHLYRGTMLIPRTCDHAPLRDHRRP
jgi:hypothetical protein